MKRAATQLLRDRAKIELFSKLSNFYFDLRPPLGNPPGKTEERKPELRKFDQVVFQLDIEKIPTEQIKFVSKVVNKMWLLWKTIFLDILNKHTPVTNIRVKSNHLPYVTSELRDLTRQRDYLRAKANKSGLPLLRQAFVQVRQK